jgi:hypothetical protein
MAQAEHVTTAIRKLMSRGQPLKSTNRVRAAHTEFVAALAGNAPHPISSGANACDLDVRDGYLENIFTPLHSTSPSSTTTRPRISPAARPAGDLTAP